MPSERAFFARRWGADERKTGLLAAVLVGAFVAYFALYLGVTLHRGARPFGDFFALWSYAKIAVAQPAASLYDPAALHDAQVALGMEPGQQNPFPYPPSFLLVLWPLGFLSYTAAYVVWIGTTLALYVWATMERQGRTMSIVLALAAPTTTIMVVAGQSGFLAGALAIGGFRTHRHAPDLGGRDVRAAEL